MTACWHVSMCMACVVLCLLTHNHMQGFIYDDLFMELRGVKLYSVLGGLVALVNSVCNTYVTQT